MKAKNSFLIIIALVLTLALSSCSTQEEKSTEQSSNSEKVTYTCPMHPEVTSDIADKCPKCGMELVQNEAHEHEAHEHDMDNDTMKME
ncbi:MAG: hypothetical protein A2X08_09065 [Bacteroidetes bacterium GWA2_32_17]|nr:MAG: hypothetical protein A2X08_09065 [Bacteroidetes bacterium GWA2_32_17]